VFTPNNGDGCGEFLADGICSFGPIFNAKISRLYFELGSVTFLIKIVSLSKFARANSPPSATNKIKETAMKKRMLVGLVLGMAMLLVLSAAFAQTPVVPAGSGTEGNPYQISQLGHLVWMSTTVASSSGTYYTVQNDIDASETTNWYSGDGFFPIGNPFIPFLGIFNGNGKVIRNLNINLPAQSYVGLFGYVGRGGVVQDMGLIGGAVRGDWYVGGLIGYNWGKVSRCYTRGPVSGTGCVGGLAGYHNADTVSVCYAMGTITGNGDAVGGLIGGNEATVIGCHATGPVTGMGVHYNIGGLVGINHGNLLDSYATGSVIGSGNCVGGLTGGNYLSVSGCYAIGSVTGSGNVGGLVGVNQSQISDCFSTGRVVGTNFFGGLVGANNNGAVNRCYATGAVMGHDPDTIGGLVGANFATVSDSYWDTNTTDQTRSSGGTGKTTPEMKQQATFVGWDFTNIWRLVENVTYPHLRWQGCVPNNDFDGNGESELTIFDTQGGYWYIRPVSNQVVAWANQWGWSTAKPVPGDYDGDGKYDLAVFDTAGGYWYIKSISGNVVTWANQWGWSTAKPVPGDYDGDGKYDLAVFDTAGGYWYIKSASNSLIAWADQWGWSTAKPVPGDYDGDGKYDLAVFDTAGGYWYIKSASNSLIAWANQWGWSTAKPVPGDYDGDGKYDLAVFDTAGGYWYIKSLDGRVITWANQWGWSTAKPVSGDFDGDGKYDLAVYDTVTCRWYIKSIDGRVIAWAVQWGFPSGLAPALGD